MRSQSPSQPAAAASADHGLPMQLEAADPVPSRRQDFHIPPDPRAGGGEAAYLAGNSLGLQPRGAADDLQQVLTKWADIAVDGHFAPPRPWASYPDLARPAMARLIGAEPDETVIMNSLTVNLHLLMTSFYRPSPQRSAILIEDSAFPSDSYAVASQAAVHGLDPQRAVIRIAPRPDEAVLRTEDVVELLARRGHEIALVLLGGVNYLTGELLDIKTITEAGHDAGAFVGWDLAHAAGNVELQLHDWDVDWAAWCNYKYLNAGPGAVAAAFIHRRHLANSGLLRLAGWWGNEPQTRFQMQDTIATPDTADAWQLSTPTTLAIAPLLSSLDLFDSIGMPALTARGARLTGYLQDLIDEIGPGRGLSQLTPREPSRRGAQLSIRCSAMPANQLSSRLAAEHGVIADARGEDVIRLAPAPLYSSYLDCWRAARALATVLGSSSD